MCYRRRTRGAENPTDKGNSTQSVTEPTAVVIPNTTVTQPNDPPNSLLDIITEYGDVADFPDAGVEE